MIQIAFWKIVTIQFFTHSVMCICMHKASARQDKTLKNFDSFRNNRLWNLTTSANCKHCHVFVLFKIFTNLPISMQCAVLEILKCAYTKCFHVFLLLLSWQKPEDGSGILDVVFRSLYTKGDGKEVAVTLTPAETDLGTKLLELAFQMGIKVCYGLLPTTSLIVWCCRRISSSIWLRIHCIKKNSQNVLVEKVKDEQKVYGNFFAGPEQKDLHRWKYCMNGLGSGVWMGQFVSLLVLEYVNCFAAESWQ